MRIAIWLKWSSNAGTLLTGHILSIELTFLTKIAKPIVLRDHLYIETLLMDWHVATRADDNLVAFLFILRTPANHANNFVIMNLILLPLKLKLFVKRNLSYDLILDILLSHLNQLVFYSKIGLDIVEQICTRNLTIKSKVVFRAIFLLFVSAENLFLLDNRMKSLSNLINSFLNHPLVLITSNLKLLLNLI